MNEESEKSNMAHNNLKSSKEKRAMSQQSENRRRIELSYLIKHGASNKARERFERPAYSIKHPQHYSEEE